MKDYFKVTPAVFAIFRNDSKVMLTRRFQTGWMDGKYSLPSGHFEGNESPEQGAIREIYEEVGVIVHPAYLRFVHTVYRKEKDSNAEERIDFFFEVDKYEGKIHNAEPEKCDDISWFELSKLPDNTVPIVKNVLESISKGKYYSSYGLGE